MIGIIGTSHSKSKVIGRSQDTAKVWVHFNGPAENIDDSYNVGSITDLGVGSFQVNFLNNLANIDYAVVSGDYYWGIGIDSTFTVSSVKTTRRTNGSGGSAIDTPHTSLIIFGS